MNIFKKIFNRNKDNEESKEIPEVPVIVKNKYSIEFKLRNGEVRTAVGFYIDGLDAIRNVEDTLDSFEHFIFENHIEEQCHLIKSSDVIEVIVSDYEEDKEDEGVQE